LEPVKVFLSGPPASGKTHFGQKLATLYNIPLIQVKDVAEAIVKEESELAETVRTRLEEERDAMASEINANLGEDEEEVDPATLNPRIPDELLADVFKWRLAANQCRNRGYVLDGWPKTYDSTKKVFMKPEEPPEGEEPNPDEETLILDHALLPKSVVIFKGDFDAIKQRVKELPEAAIQGTHYNESDMERRNKVYAETNLSEKGLYSVTDFFIEQGVTTFEQDCLRGESDIFESL
jgi:adenylate kinase